jgi:phage shock protein C
MGKRLYRSRKDRMLFGVCGGLAEYFGIDPTVMRIVAVVLALASGVGILIYFIMAFIIPLDGTSRTSPRDIVVDNAYEIKDTAEELGQEVRDTFVGKKQTSEEDQKVLSRRRNALGIGLVVLGVLILLGVLGIFRWFSWGAVGAVVLIIVGVMIIVSMRKK